MRAKGSIARLALALGLASERDVREAWKLRYLARVQNGLDLGTDEALLWIGAISLDGVDKLRRGGGMDEALGDRFGRVAIADLAVAMGFVTPEQVTECLEIRERRGKDGGRPLLGEVLLERGYVGPCALRQLVDVLVDEGMRPAPRGATGRHPRFGEEMKIDLGGFSLS